MRAIRRFAPSAEAVEGRILLSAPQSDAPPPPLTPEELNANVPPAIENAGEVIRHHKVVAFQITFTKDINPGPLTDLSHYALYDQVQRKPYRGSAVLLASATYDPNFDRLTLVPASPAPLGSYVLTSPNPDDPSTAFIADAEGRPLITSTGNFTVFFSPNAANLRNLVLTPYPVINHETGASAVASVLASFRSEQKSLSAENNAVLVSGPAGIAVAISGLLAKSL